jgi:hypothetical protein
VLRDSVSDDDDDHHNDDDDDDDDDEKNTLQKLAFDNGISIVECYGIL